MPRGVKNPEKTLVIRGRGMWKQKPPLTFETTHGYLWVGLVREGQEPEYLFSISPADMRKLGRFLTDGGQTDVSERTD